MLSMYKGLYLLCLLVALGGLAVIDARYRLVFWQRPKHAAASIGLAVAFFLIWDMVGIHEQIFYIGDGQVLTGLRLTAQLPVEEPVFLTLLVYQTFILWEVLGRWRAR